MQPKIILHRLDTSYIDAIMPYINDPEVCGNFANLAVPVSRNQELEYLERIVSSEHDRAFAVHTTEGEYLGTVGLHQIDWQTRSGRLGIIIGNTDQRNKGYGQAALQEIIKLAFEQYNLHKVWGVVFEDNKRSCHVFCVMNIFIVGNIIILFALASFLMSTLQKERKIRKRIRK